MAYAADLKIWAPELETLCVNSVKFGESSAYRVVATPSQASYYELSNFYVLIVMH